MSIRIGGLASGMDIDSIVRDMMKVERMPLDRLFQKKQTLEWQRDGYRGMNKLLKDLDNLLSVTTTNGIGRQSTFLTKNVISSDESKVTARNINSTANLTTTIGVKQVAESASMYSKGDIRANTNFSASNTLQSEIDAGNLSNAYSSNTFTIQAIQADGTLAPITEKNTFTIDPATQSLNDIINEINNRKIGVSAFYDEQTGRLAVTANQTGDVAGDAEIKLTGDFLTSTLQLENDNETAAATVDALGNSKLATGSLGENAIVQINGLETTRFSNTFQINGYEFTVKGTTSLPVSISSTTDTETIYKSITDFVNKYNETIETINGKLAEERYRKFPPLTDEQKENMSDKEIELWEEKAKSGLLRNDSLISSGLNKMRQDLYSKVSGIADGFAQLIDIGIKPSSNYRDKGKLVIDEGKLRDAIAKDPTEIYKLFNNDGMIDDVNNPGTKIFSESHLGLAKKLRETIKETVTSIEAKAGNTLKVYSQYTIGRDLNNIDSQIDRFQDRLIGIENRYWKQFTAMEKAIDRANQQSGYLMQQFSGM